MLRQFPPVANERCIMRATNLSWAAALVVAVTCAGPLAGCVSDGGTKPVAVADAAHRRASGDNSENVPMRYYGGPKSPMWRAQQ